jgi:PAS domain-containing protein
MGQQFVRSLIGAMMPRRKSQAGCLYCGKRLSLVAQFKNVKYCSEEHRQLFMQRRDRSGVEELMIRRERTAAVEPLLEEARDEELTQPEPAPRPELEDATPTVGPPEPPLNGDSIEERYARFLSMIDTERHFYQELLDRLPAAVAVIGPQMQVRYSNRAFRQFQAREEDEVDRPSVTSEEVRDAIRGILSASQEASAAESVSFERRGGQITLVPVPTLSEDGQPSQGAMIFVTETTEVADAALAGY